MPNLPRDAFLPEYLEKLLQSPLPTTISELEEQIGQVEKEQARCEKDVRSLMAREDFARDIFFAKEIHELRQIQNMLETRREFCKVRINRLRQEPQKP